MVEEWESHSVHVQLIMTKMVSCVIQNAEMVSRELDLFVGKVVHLASEMMELFVSNQNLMEEEQVTLFGTKENVKEAILKVVRKMVPCGTQNAEVDTNQ